jgi:hypothetical protein
LTSLCLLPPGAQSLPVNSPAPMNPGVNQAAVDSFAGGHFWYFYAMPGRFRIVFSASSPQEGFAIGSRPVAAAAFAPKTAGAVIHFRELSGSTVFEGSVTVRTRVIVEVQPRRGLMDSGTHNLYFELQ